MASKGRVCLGASCFAGSLALLAASCPSIAAAKPAQKPITGKLSKPGYTVIALSAGGRASSIVAAANGRFELRPPAGRVALQLRGPDGVYAGPIVVGGKTKRVIVGVKAGARLGTVKVKPRKGYAKLARALPRQWLDPKRWARARKGVPIGAGRFGRVRSRNAHGGVPGDLDLDGIPDPLDIDDDGDLVLDNFEHSGAARASQAENGFGISSVLTLYIQQTANADAAASNPNAPGLTAQDIDAALAGFGVLMIQTLPGDSEELDCGDPDTGLVYCRKNGSSGKVFDTGLEPFPSCCDADNDGFGTLFSTPGNFPGAFFLKHGATTAQIKTGDQLIERVTTGGVESQFTAALQTVLATVPALVSYSDTATPTPHSAAVSYPVAPPNFGGGGPPGGPGTEQTPFPVKEGADGNIDLTLRFWRPQRAPIGDELCPPPAVGGPCWIDIGGLSYGVALGYTPELPPPYEGGVKGCPQSSLHDPTPGLTPTSLPAGLSLVGGFFSDGAADQPADPANRLGYSVNITQCIAALNDELHSQGVTQSISWDPGETQELIFMATNLSDNAQQHVFFRRP